ncbi:Nitrilase/cyanide hydratase and apolipo protein N-acyltransferase [Halteromyces radiatus]|uniref:Nitrilase/cyanide hydratase and apolipo protein N-acyltransferase n=1 Tax=Halteromyces radiatus TaxID=101107 RepID=UPI002220B146|nr:Nitrilase/cyanide hydratase and apolipo protein N-acyltransferase [Halteromyces radiatus]KAI8089631.1 Nitrilase/cyanide hydratase and apolipo protein N-acyltransferase [Halteromyces radiatus]
MTLSKTMRIAAVQLYIDRTNAGNNWARAKDYVKKAAEAKADLVVFPEYFISMSVNAFPELLPRIVALAQEYDIDIVTGTYPEKGKDGKLYNCCSYVDKEGIVLLTYRKVHLWHPEREKFTPGNSFGTVVNRFGIKVGLCVCWDIAFNDCFTEMALNQDAELIVAPSYWALEDAGDIGQRYRQDSEVQLLNAMCTARSFENGIVMVFVNGASSPLQYGQRDNSSLVKSDHLTLAGRTQITAPFKGVLARCDHSYEEMLIQDVDIGQMTLDAETVYKIRDDWKLKKDAAKL